MAGVQEPQLTRPSPLRPRTAKPQRAGFDSPLLHQQGLGAARPFGLSKGGQRGPWYRLGPGVSRRAASPIGGTSLVGDACGVISPLTSQELEVDRWLRVWSGWTRRLGRYGR
jgi:hypothetical protein